MSKGKASEKKFIETQTLNKLESIPEQKKTLMAMGLEKAIRNKSLKKFGLEIDTELSKKSGLNIVSAIR